MPEGGGGHIHWLHNIGGVRGAIMRVFWGLRGLFWGDLNTKGKAGKLKS